MPAPKPKPMTEKQKEAEMAKQQRQAAKNRTEFAKNQSASKTAVGKITEIYKSSGVRPGSQADAIYKQALKDARKLDKLNATNKMNAANKLKAQGPKINTAPTSGYGRSTKPRGK